jgi:hypothetical protein
MPTVHNVTTYNYQFHGGPNGYQGHRAVARLNNGSTSVAYLYFIPEGKAIPADTDSGSWIKMYMPESSIPAVIDMLRNEKPVKVYFASGSGFLLTGDEPIGENE